MISECGNLTFVGGADSELSVREPIAYVMTDFVDASAFERIEASASVRGSVAYRPTVRFVLRDPVFPEDPDILQMEYDVLAGWIYPDRGSETTFTGNKTVAALVEVSLDVVLSGLTLDNGPATESLKFSGAGQLLLDGSGTAADYRFWVKCDKASLWAENGYCYLSLTATPIQRLVVQCKYKDGKTWSDAQAELTSSLNWLLSESTPKIVTSSHFEADRSLIGKSQYEVPE